MHAQKITQIMTLRQMVPGNSKPITPSKDGQAERYDRHGTRKISKLIKKAARNVDQGEANQSGR